MLKPIPIVAVETGEVEDAPEGSIPVALYGAGSGGGGGGSDIQIARFSTPDLDLSVTYLEEPNAPWVSFRFSGFISDVLSGTPGFKAALPANFEDELLMNLENTSPALISVSGTPQLAYIEFGIFIGDTEGIGVSGRNIVVLIQDIAFPDDGSLEIADLIGAYGRFNF